jgi:O-antigen/teichoic acid export membrane protein
LSNAPRGSTDASLEPPQQIPPRPDVTRRSRFGQATRGAVSRRVINTAGYNVAIVGAGSISGLILARYLGPTGRGEYAAVTTWFAVVALIAEFGQPAAICYYISSQPARAAAYVATAQRLLLGSGVLAALLALAITPLITIVAQTTFGCVILFAIVPVVAVGYGWLYSLQPLDLSRWNRARLTQPTLYLVAIVILGRTHTLTLQLVFIVLAASLLAQTVMSRQLSRAFIDPSGAYDRALIRALSTYGASNLAATAPSVVNVRLDQIVLSLAVPASQLGQYAVAVSLTTLAYPLASAFGYVAMPRLAALRGDKRRDVKGTLVGAFAVGTLVTLPIAAFAPWYVPLVFGTRYHDVILLVWLLAPGGVFLAAGQVMGDVLRGLKRPIDVAKSQGVGAVFTVVGLAISIPMWGAQGAAVTSSIAYGITCLWQWPAIRRSLASTTAEVE